MNSDRRLSAARSIVAAALHVAPGMIGDHASVDSLENWDSLGHMRLVLEIERHLKRELSAEEIVDLTSLSDVQKLLAAADRP